MKEKQRYHIGIGVPSILMIFVVLCLTTFGVLSYSSASADYRLTEKNAAYVQAYYKADGCAQKVLQEIDSILYEAELAASDETVYRDNVCSLLNSLGVYEMAVSETAGEIYVSCQVPVYEEKKLFIGIKIHPMESKTRYTIEEYYLGDGEASAVGGIIIEEESVGLWQGW